jgi:hypothetical protein
MQTSNQESRHNRSTSEWANLGIRHGWFTETEAMWPGQKFALALEVRWLGHVLRGVIYYLYHRSSRTQIQYINKPLL